MTKTDEWMNLFLMMTIKEMSEAESDKLFDLWITKDDVGKEATKEATKDFKWLKSLKEAFRYGFAAGVYQVITNSTSEN